MVRPVATQRLFRFLVVGVGAAALLFLLSYFLVSSGMPPFAANTLAYLLAFAAAYSAQHGWTFGAKHQHGRALPRYFVLQAGCALFSGLVAHIAVTRFAMSPLAMSAMTTVATSAASFVLSSVWVFPDRG
ncbi:hypothetical protein MAUB1S_07598 [Mycolicibacterium aubagnense]